MNGPGGEVEPVALDESRRVALERLLEASVRLCELGKRGTVYASLGELGDFVAEQACALAGLHVQSHPESPAHRVVFVVELEQPTTKLWDCHAHIPKEKVTVRYCDGPSREVAIASGLILLARAILDRLPTEGLITPEVGLSCDLEEAMAEYEQALVPSAEELARQRAEHPPVRGEETEPELNCHGMGGVD